MHALIFQNACSIHLYVSTRKHTLTTTHNFITHTRSQWSHTQDHSVHTHKITVLTHTHTHTHTRSQCSHTHTHTHTHDRRVHTHRIKVFTHHDHIVNTSTQNTHIRILRASRRVFPAFGSLPAFWYRAKCAFFRASTCAAAAKSPLFSRANCACFELLNGFSHQNVSFGARHLEEVGYDICGDVCFVCMCMYLYRHTLRHGTCQGCPAHTQV